MFHRGHAIWLLCLALAAGGCGGTDEPSSEVASAVAAKSPPRESSGESRVDAAKWGNSSPSPPASKSSPIAEFVPPFPDRLELFEPPKRAQGNIRRDADRGETVELKGFVHVDQPRVVLSIDGVVSPIAEGGERYGVHVISIQPPTVVLQRGRDRWTATLE